jgi:hypothetical protein
MRAAAETSWRKDVAARTRRLSAALTAGCVVGATVGGVGGRLAMLVLRLMSDPALHGLETDDGFTIGVISGASLFLLILTALGGAVGGLIYLVVRSWLPRRARPWLFGGLAGVVGGAVVIRPDGIDFTLLRPLWLAVVMFVALPAAYGVAVSFLVERFLASDSAFRGPAAWIAGLALLLPIAILGPAGLIAIAAILIWLLLGRRVRGASSLWTSPTVVWVGRVGLAAIGAMALADFVGDVAQVV